MTKLSREYYLHDDVVSLARDLIGKRLVTNFDGFITSGIISETEAYKGVNDRASHAYGGRNTKRTQIMYSAGGTAYVYLCYGIHHLFNVVTNQKGIPHAVLIRAMIPEKGIELMKERRNITDIKKLSNGPGTVSQALGITTFNTGFDLLGEQIWIEETGFKIPDEGVNITPRIGVDYAGEDALLPYRFVLKKDFKPQGE